ncbi:MAG: hypothetical protein FWH22_01505 [Fibromonadales bacterium]|nr:hypothetical protein [Fibromonadales bacterium]
MQKRKLKILIAFFVLLLAFFAIFLKNNFTEIKNNSTEMKMPFVALNIVSRTQIQITSNKEYLENLEKQSGLNRKEIKKLFKYLLKNTTKDEVRKNANSEMSKSLKEFWSLPDNKRLDFFIINILAPYLTMAVNNFAVNNTDEKEIQTVFSELFNVSKDKMNPLAELTEGTYRYYYGGTYNLGDLYELNDYLKSKGFYLDYNLKRSYANIFKIDRVICADEEWKHGKKISIFLLKRIYPNILRSNLLGYAPAWNSDVVVMKDFFYDIAKGYKKELREKMPKMPYRDPSYQSLWYSMNLNIDLERANRIRYELAYKDLKGPSLSEIERDLIIQTAIHEAKHRIDEIEMPSMRLNLDLEISAYLTEAIAGVYPFLGLRNIIEWTEAYYRSTKYARLRYLLAELWILADESLKQNYTEKVLRAELIKIYENYLTIQENASFIDLTEFEQRMIPIILQGRL